jgi:hypothetical protein
MAQDPRLEAADIAQLWPQPVTMAQVGRGQVKRDLVADAEVRAGIARALRLDDLLELQADLKVTAWLDGVEIDGRWRARVVQTCGITLEPFESALDGELHVRVLPEGSSALGGESEHELDLDPEADDPPDLMTGDGVDLGAYVVEDLSLAIDPFPRKPGAEFDPPDSGGDISPFAVLAKLKGGTPDA